MRGGLVMRGLVRWISRIDVWHDSGWRYSLLFRVWWSSGCGGLTTRTKRDVMVRLKVFPGIEEMNRSHSTTISMGEDTSIGNEALLEDFLGVEGRHANWQQGHFTISCTIDISIEHLPPNTSFNFDFVMGHAIAGYLHLHRHRHSSRRYESTKRD